MRRARRTQDTRSRRSPCWRPAATGPTGRYWATASSRMRAVREGRHPSCASARVAAAEDMPKRQCQDPQIKPQRPVFDVVEVVLYPLGKVAAAAQVVDLCLARDAGLDKVFLHVAGHISAKLLHEFRTLWTRAHQRHLAS